MGNVVTLIFVVMVIVMGIGACWVIAANGSATDTPKDTFGNTPPATAIAQDAGSSSLATHSMPVVFIAFFIAICVVLVAAFTWLWKTGKTKASAY